MKNEEGVRTLGWMLGTIGSFLILKQAGVEPHLLRLVIAVLVGVLTGWLSSKVYGSSKKE